MDELCYSETWKQGKEEDALTFNTRKVTQTKVLYDMRRKHGQCYLVKFGEEDIRPMWEDVIDINQLSKDILSPMGTVLDCPLCQPYDNWNTMEGHYDSRRYMCKIVNPKYPEGVIDRGGVWQKCACVCEPEKKKYLKFKRS